LVNPTDPISQQEWAKQMAVKRVRPKLGLNEDRLPDEKALKDTIEVFAFFIKEDGFFGLTSYLSYAADQLKRSNDWIETTRKLKLAPHEFPWRKIDDANIETQGSFETRLNSLSIKPEFLICSPAHALQRYERSAPGACSKRYRRGPTSTLPKLCERYWKSVDFMGHQKPDLVRYGQRHRNDTRDHHELFVEGRDIFISKS
jgi:hypothetical protein